MDAYLNECEYLCLDCAGDDIDENNVYDLEYEESDSPQHCAQCHRPLENSLTSDGVQYVLDAIREEMGTSRIERKQVATHWAETDWYYGSTGEAVVRDWAKQIQWYGGLTEYEEELISVFLG